MHALLVVHEPHSCAVLESTLERCGWSVERVGEAAVLLGAAGDERASLVVIGDDPAGAAIQSCASLRRDSNCRDAYVILLVPGGDPAAFAAAAGAGADDMLALPLQEEEVEARLRVAGSRLDGVDRARWRARAAANGDPWPTSREFRVQQAFFETLFEGAPEGVVILDAEHRVVRINSEFTRLFGYLDEEARGRPINDLIVPARLRAEGIELDSDVRRGKRVMVETVRRHRDGHLIDVSVLATTIMAQSPIGTFGIYRDITEKKRREAALRASEERYRALFDQSPVGVFLCGRDLRITHCNEYLTRVTGAPYEELVGADLISIRDTRLMAGLRAALDGEPAFYEGPFRTLSGKMLHVSVQYAPLRDHRGEVLGGIGVLEDVTDRVDAEIRQRAQAAEMERVNAALRERTLELEAALRARSRLYTAMNHELRTPISSILLYQELLMSGALGGLSADQVAALEHSHTATRHLLELVQDILDLSRIEAGKVSVQPAEVSVRSLLHELQASVAALTERHGSRLRLEIEDGVGSIVTDAQRLRQILLNFVSNAAKYGRRQPIDLRCRRRDSGEVVFEVVDRGIGIAAEDLSSIFEEFVQLGTAPGEGTGLGLAISRGLSELIEGELEVESKPGVGSTFRLIVPEKPGIGMPLEFA